MNTLLWIVYCAGSAFNASGSLDPANCQAVTIAVADCPAAVEAYKQSGAPELLAKGAQLYPDGTGFVMCEGQRFSLTVTPPPAPAGQ